MTKTIFICQSCGAQYPKWQGQCVSCGEWNTLVEEVMETAKSKKGGGGGGSLAEAESKLVTLPEIEAMKVAKNRFPTGIAELDRVLGGEQAEAGMVPGGVILLGGEPGIGKSTLLTQMMVEYEGIANQKSVSGQAKVKIKSTTHILYVCGEESPQQISLRLRRILEKEYKNTSKRKVGVTDFFRTEQIVFATTTDVDQVVALIKERRPTIVIVDSIQTMSTNDLTGSAGSVGQVRETTDRLTNMAKITGSVLFLVGHVTKEGAIAGPKVLEHIVDTVLELSGERTGQLRILRAIKNRFGATDEVGVFQITDVGLVEVTNPSELFLEHTQGTVPGSATVCVMEGTRPLLVEVQSLVTSSVLAMPRRVGRGIDVSRIQVLAAVLQKHCGLPLGSHDIFANVAGGYMVKEPAIDLGLAAALASSLKNKPLPAQSVFIGEVGLLGEIRPVSYMDRRIKEAKRLGYTTIYTAQTHKRVKELFKKLQLA